MGKGVYSTLDTLALYEIADAYDINIINTDCLKETSSCSIRQEDTYYIGISEEIRETAELNVHLAHELGHCLTGSVYNMYAPLDNRAKHELRADRWAIKKLVPPAKLRTAIKKGIREVWELAEYFQVTEDYIIKAIAYASDKRDK